MTINPKLLYKNFSRVSITDSSNHIKKIQENPAIVLGAAPTIVENKLALTIMAQSLRKDFVFLNTEDVTYFSI